MERYNYVEVLKISGAPVFEKEFCEKREKLCRKFCEVRWGYVDFVFSFWHDLRENMLLVPQLLKEIGA